MEVLVLQKVPFRMIECLVSCHLYLLKQESYLSILSKLALPKNYLPSTEGHCHGLINDGWVLEPYCDRRSFGIASKRAAEVAAKETMIQYCQSWFCLTTIGSQAFWTGMTALSLPAYKTFLRSCSCSTRSKTCQFRSKKRQRKTSNNPCHWIWMDIPIQCLTARWAESLGFAGKSRQWKT